MSELLAGALVAAAAVAYVLEPLVRGGASMGRRETSLTPEAETVVRQMRERLIERCPRCDTPREQGFAFCSKCGAPLIER
jgi:hypothetical protein